MNSPGEIAALEALLQKNIKELFHVDARLEERLGPIERKELNTKKGELESEIAGLRNQIRLAEAEPSP